MMYKSTRGYSAEYSFSDAVLTGIAPDGGLFVPIKFPRFDSLEFAELCGMDYCSLAIEIFARFVTDFTRAELERCVRNAYASGSFPQDPAPVVSLSSSLNVLELWHGPTLSLIHI